MTDRYAVFGNPIAHSKSPLIHTLFAKQTQQDLSYDKKHIELDQFAHEARTFFHEGGQGLNITVPFKLDAFTFSDVLTQRAKLAGAVNTLKKQEDGKILGDNTDGVGLVRDITKNLGWNIKGNHILILGAGGAVRGVLTPLLEQAPQKIVIANRTLSKAQELIPLMKSDLIFACSYENIPAHSFELVINGTSSSLAGDLPPLENHLLASYSACYDMMYSKQPTPFMAWASSLGCTHVADGLGMLVEQAAESFRLWRESRDNPILLNTQAVIDEVRRQL